jgi:hypothetical protein
VFWGLTDWLQSLVDDARDALTLKKTKEQDDA